MDNAKGHLAILAGAGGLAVLVSAYMTAGPATRTAGAAQGQVVVAVPPRVPEPRPAVRPVPNDRASLTRALQAELRRVGCYEGDITGYWDARSRTAMKSFTERVNATLPVDQPDQVLLALVQAHQGKACDVAPARSVKRPEPPRSDAMAKADPPAIVAPVPVPAVRRPELAARETAPRMPAVAPEPPPVAHREVPPSDAAALPPQSKPPQVIPQPAGPIPSVGIYERRIKRLVRRAPAKSAAYARSLLRSLERAATAW